MRFDDLLQEMASLSDRSTWRNLPTLSNNVLNRAFTELAQVDCTGLDAFARKQIHGILVISLDQTNDEHLAMIKRWEERWLGKDRP